MYSPPPARARGQRAQHRKPAGGRCGTRLLGSELLATPSDYFLFLLLRLLRHTRRSAGQRRGSRPLSAHREPLEVRLGLVLQPQRACSRPSPSSSRRRWRSGAAPRRRRTVRAGVVGLRVKGRLLKLLPLQPLADLSLCGAAPGNERQTSGRVPRAARTVRLSFCSRSPRLSSSTDRACAVSRVGRAFGPLRAGDALGARTLRRFECSLMAGRNVHC